MARTSAASRARGGRGSRGRGRGSSRGTRGRGSGTAHAGPSQYGQVLQEPSSPPGSPPPPDDENDDGELSIDMEKLTVMCYMSQEMIHVSNLEEMADQLEEEINKTVYEIQQVWRSEITPNPIIQRNRLNSTKMLLDQLRIHANSMASLEGQGNRCKNQWRKMAKISQDIASSTELVPPAEE